MERGGLNGKLCTVHEPWLTASSLFLPKGGWYSWNRRFSGRLPHICNQTWLQISFCQSAHGLLQRSYLRPSRVAERNHMRWLTAAIPELSVPPPPRNPERLDHRAVVGGFHYSNSIFWEMFNFLLATTSLEMTKEPPLGWKAFIFVSSLNGNIKIILRECLKMEIKVLPPHLPQATAFKSFIFEFKSQWYIITLYFVWVS